MITGIIFITLSVIVFYYVYTSDLEEVVTDNESFGKIKIYLGIAVLFIIGITSILNNWLKID